MDKLKYAVAGIDYSMTHPAMVIYSPDYEQHYWFYMSNTKSKLKQDTHLESAFNDSSITVNHDIIDGKVNSSILRFRTIGSFFAYNIEQFAVSKVFLEGYALGAMGKVFSIAENTAILKNLLFEIGVDTTIIPPTVVKKYATGKGNSRKEAMKEAFERTTEYAKKDLLAVSHYKESPYTDLIDAYWVLQSGLSSTSST